MSTESGLDYFRTVVSGKKKRFIQDGFNLDLSYITPRLLAMGYPADSIHKAFRNDINHVYSFFEKYHQGHWKVLNVAKEISYSQLKLDGNVIIRGFEDHSPPPFLLLLDIIKVIDHWLSLDALNVIAIHCKAGKGRTGTIIVSYLIHDLLKTDPEQFYSSNSVLCDMISFFNDMRSHGACITVPSQKRYIGYYIEYLKNNVTYNMLISPPQLKLVNLEIISSQLFNFNIEIHLNYNPSNRNLPIIITKSNSKYNIYNYSSILIESFYKDIIACGDTLVKFNHPESSQCIFRFIFHTAFVQYSINPDNPNDQPLYCLEFNKSNLDGGNGGQFDDNRYLDNFTIRLTMKAFNNYNNNSNIQPIINQQLQQPQQHTIVRQTQEHQEQEYTTHLTNQQVYNYLEQQEQQQQQQLQLQQVSQQQVQPIPPPIPDRSKKPIYFNTDYQL